MHSQLHPATTAFVTFSLPIFHSDMIHLGSRFSTIFSSSTRTFFLVGSPHIMPSLIVKHVPLFEDNYAYIIQNDVHRTTLLVDPADAVTSLKAADSTDCELVGVLTTHHHWDHAGGNADVAVARKGIEIVGGSEENGRIPAATRFVNDGERFELCGFQITALHTPCHTKGHVCYLVEGDPDAPPAVFTGDTLFAGGCGRFFEGDAAAMHASLAKLAALPPAARVYCGHEYTVANLRFCAHVEPGNAAITRRLEEAQALRAAGLPTVPTTIGLELETNVFMRTDQPDVWRFTHPDCDVARAAGASPPGAEVLARLREAKNGFKA